jgi:hypothetical protein
MLGSSRALAPTEGAYMSEENKESRINVDDLPKDEQELSPEEAKEVQGGLSSSGPGVYRSLDSGQTWVASTQSPDDTIKTP